KGSSRCAGSEKTDDSWLSGGEEGGPLELGRVTQVRGLNFYLTDPVLRRLLANAWAPPQRERAEAVLARLGQLAGTLIDEQAEYTDRFARPRLVTHDRDGNPANQVDYNPLLAE